MSRVDFVPVMMSPVAVSRYLLGAIAKFTRFIASSDPSRGVLPSSRHIATSACFKRIGFHPSLSQGGEQQGAGADSGRGKAEASNLPIRVHQRGQLVESAVKRAPDLQQSARFMHHGARWLCIRYHTCCRADWGAGAGVVVPVAPAGPDAGAISSPPSSAPSSSAPTNAMLQLRRLACRTSTTQWAPAQLCNIMPRAG